MKKAGSIIHNDIEYKYIVDDDNEIWIKKENSRFNYKNPVLDNEKDFESYLHKMLDLGGY